MIQVGIALIVLGGVFVFAGLTGTPRAVLGIEKAAAPPDNTPAQNPGPSPIPSANAPEDLESDVSTVPDEWASPVQEPEIPPPPPADGTLITSISEQTPLEIPASRRISSILLGLIGVAFGILALLDSL